MELARAKQSWFVDNEMIEIEDANLRGSEVVVPGMNETVLTLPWGGGSLPPNRFDSGLFALYCRAHRRSYRVNTAHAGKLREAGKRHCAAVVLKSIKLVNHNRGLS
jgi:hypothetical protein